MVLTDDNSNKSRESIHHAVASATQAFAGNALRPRSVRSALLRGLADAMDGAAVQLIAIADQETHLGVPRLTGEVARTTFQLRMFADLVDQGILDQPLLNPAVAGAPPVGHPALLRDYESLGPVAMFSASNFPFAFSVLGGDTASALAAGCPVIVKGHPGHPKLTQATVDLACQVIQTQGLPAGVLTLVDGEGIEIGQALVDHPRVSAVAFTGSVQGGLALWARCNARPRPIPFFGELGSINPIVAFESALSTDSQALAETLAGSITLGCGQFCTSPGLVFVPEGPVGDQFISQLVAALAKGSTHPMLHSGIQSHYEKRVGQVRAVGVETLVEPRPGCQAYVAQTDLATFVKSPTLQEEVFGSACLLVRVKTAKEICQGLEAVGGSLTVTLWGAEQPSDDIRSVLQTARQMAGRVLFASVPTGVAVAAGQHHGGPFPASTMPSTTSVGPDAMMRFLRPVCLQDAPQWVRESVHA
jgi:acyl-CoA reductase-like NAD-dependent aldehyde dehydrogenase